MREILFRGKRVDNGEWVYGSYINNGSYADNQYCIYNGVDFVIVDPKTIGQFTGLTDKNGVKIFEGDIVKCEHEKHADEIVFRDGSFIADRDEFYIYECINIEVIGNIHEV